MKLRQKSVSLRGYEDGSHFGVKKVTFLHTS